MDTTNDDIMGNMDGDYSGAISNRNKLVADLKVVLADAQQMLQTAKTSTGEKAVELRERAAASLRVASDKMVDLQAAAMERSKAAARYTDDYVHESPWRAIGIAAGVGFLLGLMVNRS